MGVFFFLGVGRFFVGAWPADAKAARKIAVVEGAGFLGSEAGAAACWVGGVFAEGFWGRADAFALGRDVDGGDVFGREGSVYGWVVEGGFVGFVLGDLACDEVWVEELCGFVGLAGCELGFVHCGVVLELDDVFEVGDSVVEAGDFGFEGDNCVRVRGYGGVPVVGDLVLADAGVLSAIWTGGVPLDGGLGGEDAVGLAHGAAGPVDRVMVFRYVSGSAGVQGEARGAEAGCD